MSTGFNAQIGGGKYALQFETDRKDLFKTVQAACYNVMDRVEYERQGKSEPAPEPQSNWISVEDRLPNKYTPIVLFVDRAYDSEGHIRVERCQMFGEYWGDDDWVIDYPEVDRVVVTHWREMFDDPQID